MSRLIISHVTGMPYVKLHTIIIPLPFLVVNSYFRYNKWSFVNERILLQIYFVSALITYLFYVKGVITEICDYLNIRCFHITAQQRLAQQEAQKLAQQAQQIKKD